MLQSDNAKLPPPVVLAIDPTMALRPEGHGDSQGGVPDEWNI
jgi:hypothetical protein